MMSAITGPFGELRIETDMIDVSSALPRPDHGWRYTDQHGHEHHWQAGREPYPTLVEVVDETYWCEGCGDEHTDSHLECPLCHEVISPGTTVSMEREYRPGRTQYLLNGQKIDEEQARRLLGE